MRISIVTPCFNSADTLADTIESVLSQTYPDVEHIIIDGGSADGTVKLIQDYAPRYGGRFRWISEPDGGIYDAINKGIAMATGDVVGVLNSDDVLPSDDIISTIAGSISSHKAVYGDVHFVKNDPAGKCVRYYSSSQFRPWQMRFGFMPAHPSFYCRRPLFNQYGYYDTQYLIAADFDLLLRYLLKHRIDAIYIPRDFVTMRTGGASTSGLASHRRILHEHLKIYRNNHVSSNVFFELLRYPVKATELLIQRLGLSNRNP